MRTLRRNKLSFKYSNLLGETPVYETDADGNIITVEVDGKQEPVETGETRNEYSVPIDFMACISESGGYAKASPFGIDVSAYDAVIMTPRKAYPITEATVIWHENEPRYLDAEKKVVDPSSADYKVQKISDSLNYTLYALRRQV